MLNTNYRIEEKPSDLTIEAMNKNAKEADYCYKKVYNEGVCDIENKVLRKEMKNITDLPIKCCFCKKVKIEECYRGNGLEAIFGK